METIMRGSIRLHAGYAAVLATSILSATSLATGVAAQALTPLVCDLSDYTKRPGSSVEVVKVPLGDILAVEWVGTEAEKVSLKLAIRDGAPVVENLALLSPDSDEWVEVASGVGFEFRIVEGLRRISNQQLAPLRDLGVELTSEVVDRHKWDVFWDAPLDLRTGVAGTTSFGRNPPPLEGVAHQPGLPRSPDEISRATATYDAGTCAVQTDGRRVSISFPGMQLGSFSGALVITVTEGTNLIRVEAVASTERPSVAYKYDVGLTGLQLSPESRIHWRDV
ncbi:uncharacterized protein METZ01_LOCUS321969, partial [marine metagenome]